jgi:hypothetical protein
MRKMSRGFFNSKNKSVTIKGAKGTNVPVSAGFWHKQNRNAKKKEENTTKNGKFNL